MKKLSEIINNLEKIKRERQVVGSEEEETYRCPICHDRGVVLNGEVAKVCGCIRQLHLEHRYRYANITPEISGCTFDRFRLDYYQGAHREMAAKVLRGAKQFARNYRLNPHCRGLLLTGDVGSGKTFIAGAITNYLIEQDVEVLFLVVPDFLEELRSTYHRGVSEGEDDNLTLLNGARQVELLILDDLGVHNYTPWTCNILYSILNYRLNYQLPVIITTNLSLDEIEKFLGERTTSRIVQMCQIYRLTVDKDIRHIKNKNG